MNDQNDPILFNEGHCPLCKLRLKASENEEGNTVQVCMGCGVSWIPAQDYHLLLQDEMTVTQENLLP